MTKKEIDSIKYFVCCPLCDSEKCVKGTDSCEAEQWAKEKAESKVENVVRTQMSLPKADKESD